MADADFVNAPVDPIAINRRELRILDASGNTVALVDRIAGTVKLTGALTALGAATVASLLLSGAGKLGLGAAEAVTIDSGVATVTRSYVKLDAEGAGTTDQLDTLTMAGAAEGDLCLLTTNATDTITVDDANIALGAATRAIAPGGSLLLQFDGTQWVERSFLTAADNT